MDTSAMDEVSRGPYRNAVSNVPTGVRPGRWVADVAGGGEVVVFIVGMRVHRWRRIRSWMPIVRAMTRMLDELYARPADGFLGMEAMRSGRTFAQVQYWGSVEAIGQFARAQDRSHAPAWADFNRRTAGSGDVGLFHETYRAECGDVESLYANMPDFGLLRARGVASRAATPRGRIHKRLRPKAARQREDLP